MNRCFILLTAFISLLLGACSLLPKPEVETRYTLSTVAVAGGEAAGLRAVAADSSHTLRIARPDVPVAYRGEQLALIKNGEQTFYAGKAWEAPVPDLLQAALVRDLAVLLPGWVVSSDTSGVRSAHELQTDVRTFATVQNGENSSVAVDMDVRLVDPATRQVVSVLPFRTRIPLAGPLTTRETVAAYQEAWSVLLSGVVEALTDSVKSK